MKKNDTDSSTSLEELNLNESKIKKGVKEGNYRHLLIIV